jgi:hypothetical protein
MVPPSSLPPVLRPRSRHQRPPAMRMIRREVEDKVARGTFKKAVEVRDTLA